MGLIFTLHSDSDYTHLGYIDYRYMNAIHVSLIYHGSFFEIDFNLQ